MRAIVTNFGSAGDLHPYLALILELRRHGHDAAFMFLPHFRNAIESYGVEFIPIGPDFEKVQHDIITTTVATANIDNSTEHILTLFAPLVEALPRMFSELSDACRDADVLISGPMQPASRMVHELTGIPFVSIQEAHFGGGGTPAYQQATSALINPFRVLQGLPPLRHPLTHDANSPQLALYAMSRHVMPPPPDWPAHYHMTGYFFLEEEKWEPYEGLAEFLAKGEPPVVISFGSMTHEDPVSVTRMILDAVEQVGCRAILQQGWSGLGDQDMPPTVHLAGFIPHTWLFRHAACVVHHGGGGTAAAALRAGVPSILIPHAADQPLWAQLAYELDATVEPIPFLDLTADRLAGAISTTLDTPKYSLKAAELRQLIRRERGVEKATLLIEELVSRIGLSWREESLAGNQPESAMDSDRLTRRREYQADRRSKRKTSAVRPT